MFWVKVTAADRPLVMWWGVVVGSIYSPVISSQYLWACTLGCDCHMCSSLLLRWDKKGKGAGIGVSLPRLVRFWWNFSKDRPCKIEMFWRIYNGYFWPHSTWSERVFLTSSVWKPGVAPRRKTHKNMPLTSFQLWVLSILSVQHLSVIIQVFLPQHWFPRISLLVGFCSDVILWTHFVSPIFEVCPVEEELLIFTLYSF